MAIENKKRRVPGTRVLSDGAYEAIQVVPDDCVEIVGKRNLTRRLGTRSYSEAARLAPPILREFERTIAKARNRPAPNATIDPRKAIQAIDTWRLTQLAQGEMRAFNEPDEAIPDPETNWNEHLAWRVRYHTLRDGLAGRGRWVEIADFDERLIEALRKSDIHISAEHPAMDKLRPAFQSAWREIVKYEDDLRAGVVRPGDVPESSVHHTPGVLPTSPVAASTVTMMDTFGLWKAEHVRGHRPLKTADEFETQVRRFIDIVGNKPISQITRRDVIKFKDAMLNYPARCPPDIVKQGIGKIFEWADENEDAPRLSAKTLNEKAFASIRAILGYAVTRGDIESNPAINTRVADGGIVLRPRLPYSNDELQSLFSSPIFLENARPKGGAGEAAKWIPLLALFTGARLEEIACLESSDIKIEAGIQYIHFQTFNDDGVRRQLKNKQARRKVPIHSTLVRLGFVQFVSDISKKGGGRLFPAVLSKREKVSAAFSQWYGRYAREFVPDRAKTFHSFRHTFKRACRQARVEKALRDAVMGHSHSDEAERYGIDEDGQGFPLERLSEAIEAVHYEGLDILAPT